MCEKLNVFLQELVKCRAMQNEVKRAEKLLATKPGEGNKAKAEAVKKVGLFLIKQTHQIFLQFAGARVSKRAMQTTNWGHSERIPGADEIHRAVHLLFG